MKTVLSAVILLSLISEPRAGEQVAKPGNRRLSLSACILQLTKKEDGKAQKKSIVFDRRLLVQENERFNVYQGFKHQFSDSGETVELGDRFEGILKFSDPQTVVVDLRISVTTGSTNSETSGAVIVTGQQYQIHSKMTLGERKVIMLSKPDDGRPRLIELNVVLQE